MNAHTTAMPAAPSPRLGPLFREAIVSAWKARIPSGLVVFIVAAVCATTLVTVGRTAAAEAQVAERMESAGARELRVTDASQELLTPTVLHQASGLSVVERAIGFGVTLDVTNAAVGRGGRSGRHGLELGRSDSRRRRRQRALGDSRRSRAVLSQRLAR